MYVKRGECCCCYRDWRFDPLVGRDEKPKGDP